jgi:2-keto-4-pentenoate hydratase/2-oxohepta-3-ene-1,7-dioic acid hydratase in catechol pathway
MPEGIRYARVQAGPGERWARLDDAAATFLDRAPWDGGQPTGEREELALLGLLCPVTPRTIFGIGRNYRAHAAELGNQVPAEPLVFTKAVSSLVAPDGAVVLPRESDQVDFEAELGVVIGKRCRRVTVEHALDYVFGYTALCDVTARDFQNKDGQWTRAKGYDTFCPVGPVLVCGIAPNNLAITLRQNGVTRQDSTTANMVFDVARLVAHLSSFATLAPGDLIATGTPEGVGPLNHGDRIEVAIAQIGTLAFRVLRED